MMNTAQDMPSAADSAQAVSTSVGSILRAARESQELTVADVAERIKFSVRQVEALEADDIKGLPEGTFLRGFVRSYARTLHLDEASLLAAMAPSHVVHGDVSEVQAGGLDFPTTKTSSIKSFYLLGGALLVAIVLALFVWTQQDTPIPEKVVVEEVLLPEVVAASAPVFVSSAVVAASAVNVAVAESNLAKTTPVSAVGIQPKVIESAKPLITQPKVVVLSAPASQLKPKQAEPTPVATASNNVVSEKSTLQLDQLKKRPIHIVFTQDSWMEIKDVNGELLLSRMNAAGTEKWIGGGRRAPYQVAIGKAGAVKVFYKGREVDLSKYSQSGVVRLVLE